ncbi:hypothetical protein LUZ61_009745 [Rhynchospora tenuis]|uniref:Uncharacterized protein n=1 Tax=Rhynchospora tenuis TaxID=198213 RepID=A0AAD5ZXX7_9POAL|nr:hypothetical protein LUZ61_009745 [Rhynchospora tenuis]
MASKTIDSYRNGAESSQGDADCKKKSVELLKELGLPKGLFPLDNIEEFEVTAFVEKGKLKKISGVKTKELLLWLSVVEVYMEEASKEKVTFKTGTGLSESFDVSAFEI